MQRVSVVSNKETRSKIKIVEHTRLQKKKKEKKEKQYADAPFLVQYK